MVWFGLMVFNATYNDISVISELEMRNAVMLSFSMAINTESKD
jgi:hypothetical protein